jgi:hypothetical protein
MKISAYDGRPAIEYTAAPFPQNKKMLKNRVASGQQKGRAAPIGTTDN